MPCENLRPKRVREVESPGTHQLARDGERPSPGRVEGRMSRAAGERLAGATGELPGIDEGHCDLVKNAPRLFKRIVDTE